MKKNTLAIGVASVVAVGVIAYFIRKSQVRKKRVTIADAGYETAHDILFPLRDPKKKR
ncbi:hypothetical protein V9K67_24300 [Paraflavisolibacter sp. H34]|uniref:hypothetical protein n=1 Tax=Huijunlia imazamoxiresistens TaxID=3127457 RepID=UPI003016AF9A